MIIIVGLGNPGKKYKKTRHNMGFLILDSFKRGKNFSDWKQSKKFQAKISEGKINRCKVILAKPQTYMNNSGKSVSLLIRYWKLEIRNLVVVHDDLDIPLGQFKVSKNRGSAGHKGVQSIIDEIKTRDFVRFRIGIKSESCNFSAIAKNVEQFVLGKFTQTEQKILKPIKKRASDALEMAIKQGVEKVMTEFN